MLQAIDILVVLKIQVSKARPTYEELGSALDISPSQAFRAVKKARTSKLLNLEEVVRPRALAEVLVYGVKYFIPATQGRLTRGMPTSHAAPPLNKNSVETQDPPPVWPYADGTVRGTAVTPIYKTAPFAARSDAHLYEYLALIDAIRIGSTREVKLAREEICSRLGTTL